MSKNMATEIRLLAPRQVPLHPEQAQEVVALLAELLLEAPATPPRLSSPLDGSSKVRIRSVVRHSGPWQDGREVA